MSEKSPSDKIDDLIGHFGFYIGTIAIIATLKEIPAGMNSVVSVFISAQTDYRCKTCFDDFLQTNSSQYEDYNQIIVDNFYKEKTKSADKCDVGFDTCMVSSEVVLGSNGWDFW